MCMKPYPADPSLWTFSEQRVYFALNAADAIHSPCSNILVNLHHGIYSKCAVKDTVHCIFYTISVKTLKEMPFSYWRCDGWICRYL